MDALLRAFTYGGGVPYADYGADMVFGQSDFNRPVFLTDLGSVWLPAMADVHTRLQSQPPARVADIGCGTGWSCIGMARAYPLVQVDGFDLDETTVRAAQQLVKDEKLGERVHIQLRDAADPALRGQYDLVTAFECVHDMSDPVRALNTMRRLVRPDGAVLVVDERVGEKFTPQGNEVEWMMYGWSLLHCLPVGMAQQPSRGTGTVMRPATLRGYALEAGFREVEILPVENYFFRLYRLLL
jgi:2-polyprenyl-3-methyl-5-hydroxy-6-metoxy-1,4-benzoquinol methylase